MRKTIFIILPFIAVLASGQVRSKVTNPYINPNKIPTLSGSNSFSGTNTFQGINGYSLTVTSFVSVPELIVGTITPKSPVFINGNIIVSSMVIKDTFGGIRWADGTVSTTAVIAATGGDMSRATYDQNTDGIVDDASKLGAQIPAYYMQASSGTEIERINRTKLDASSGTTIAVIANTINASKLDNSSGTTIATLINTKLDASSGTLVGKQISDVTNSTNTLMSIITASTSSPTYFQITVSTIHGNGTNSNIQIDPKNDKTAVSTFSPTGLCVYGDVCISSRAYFKGLFDLNFSSLTSITVNNQFELVCGTMAMIQTSADRTPGSAWFKLANDANGNANRITYVGQRGHHFIVLLTLSYETTGATLSEFAVYKNGTIIKSSRMRKQTVNTLTETSSGLTTGAYLATGDYLEIFCSTDDGDDILMNFGSIQVLPID